MKICSKLSLHERTIVEYANNTYTLLQATALKMVELQAQYWPNSPREFTPVDIEFLSCECRKYFSYVNRTKKFEGKNVFTPKGNFN